MVWNIYEVSLQFPHLECPVFCFIINNFCHWTFDFDFCRKFNLEEASALDLLAVLGGSELLHQLGVLGGDHDGGDGGKAGVKAGIRGHSSNITGNSFQTLLRLHDSLKIKQLSKFVCTFMNFLIFNSQNCFENSNVV